jgi:tetratricopeptide (TPR) repeat protein
MSDTSTARNPFVPTLPDEEMELQALDRALHLAEGFSLLFAHCNQANVRQHLVAELRKRAPDLKIQEIHFDRPVVRLLIELQQRIADPAPDALFVSGLEYSMPIAAEAHTAPVVSSLNVTRDLFPSVVPCPLVFWVPGYVLTALLRGAPDFFSVRSGVYSFAATPRETAPIAQSMTAGDEWIAANLSLAEKQEHIATIQSLLHDYQSLPSAKRDHRAEVRLLTRLGTLYFLLGHWAEAEVALQQSLAICREVGDRKNEGAILNNLGNVYSSQKRWAEAEAVYQQSLIIKQELGDRIGEGRILNNLGVIYDSQGHWAGAEQFYQQSLVIYRELGDRVEEGRILNNLGVIYDSQGRWVEAEQFYQQSLAIKRELGDRIGEGKALGNLGNVYGSQGRWIEAEAACQQCLAISREYGDRVGEGQTLNNLALLREAQGDISGAMEFGRQAVAVLETTEDKAELEKVRSLVAEWEKQALAVT